MTIEDVKRSVFNFRAIIVTVILIILFLLSDYLFIFKSMTLADLQAPDIIDNPNVIDFLYSNGHNVYQIWLQSYHYIGFLFPLLAILPAAFLLWEDRQSNFFSYSIIRTSFSKYVHRSFFIYSVAGGATIVAAEILYFVGLSLFFKHSILEEPMFLPQGPFASLFSSAPLLYIVIIWGTHFLLGFLFAAFGLSVSLFSKKRITIFAVPFLTFMVSGILLEAFFRQFAYSPLQWIQLMHSSHVNPTIMYSGILVLTTIFYTTYILLMRKARTDG